jgi:hypothetical protein
VATPITVPNVSQTITQVMKLVVNPPLTVGLSITFNLTTENEIIINGPGTGTSVLNWNIAKNNVPLTTIVGTPSSSEGTRPNCSPNTQTTTTTKYENSITINSEDIITITATTVDTITNGQVAAQTNCTTNINSVVRTSILTPAINGNTCSSVISSGSRIVSENVLTYVPIVVPPVPPVSLCFGYLYNFYAITGSTSQSLTSSDTWSVPTEADFNTLVSSVSNNGNSLKLVDVTTYWDSGNINATNSSGFGAVGDGARNDIGFLSQKTSVYYCSKTSYSSTQSIGLTLSSSLNSAVVGGAPGKSNGNPIRLVKNTTTLSPGQKGTYTGNDGKIYNTICIGTQEWMSDDLRETKYRGLGDIPNVTAQSTWSGLTTGAYCIYNNDLNNVAGCPTSNPTYNNYLPTGSVNRNFNGVAIAPNNDAYTTSTYSTGEGDICEKLSSDTTFNRLSVTSRQYNDIAATPSGDIYAVVYFGGIYKQTNGTGSFVSIGQDTNYWTGICSATNNDMYACESNTGRIFKKLASETNFTTLYATTGLSLRDITIDASGNIYICDGNDIYKQTGGIGSFNPLGTVGQVWTGLAAAPNGDVFACSEDTFDTDGGIFVQYGGTGEFISLNQANRDWSAIAVSNGVSYATVAGGDVYKMTF